jgi:hypothetical protein
MYEEADKRLVDGRVCFGWQLGEKDMSCGVGQCWRVGKWVWLW